MHSQNSFIETSLDLFRNIYRDSFRHSYSYFPRDSFRDFFSEIPTLIISGFLLGIFLRISLGISSVFFFRESCYDSFLKLCFRDSSQDSLSRFNLWFLPGLFQDSLRDISGDTFRDCSQDSFQDFYRNCEIPPGVLSWIPPRIFSKISLRDSSHDSLGNSSYKFCILSFAASR